MEKKVDATQEKQTTIENQSSVVEPVTTGRYVDKSQPDDDAFDEEEVEGVEEETEDEAFEEPAELEEEEDDESLDDEDEALADDEPDDEDEKPPVKEKKRLSKEQRKIRALKIEAKKLRDQLKEQQDKSREDELYDQYANEYDEKEARRRARAESKQEAIERQVNMLLFEKQNRRVLQRFPEAENDIDKIMRFAESGMTVEQVCRGLYGTEVPERERRAIEALTEPSQATGTNSSVSRSMRTPASQVKTKLTQEQQSIKRHIERNVARRKLTDKEFLEIYEE